MKYSSIGGIIVLAFLLATVGCSTAPPGPSHDVGKMRNLVTQAQAGADGDCLMALHEAAVSLSTAKATLAKLEREPLDDVEYNRGIAAAETAIKARQIIAKACTQRYAALKQSNQQIQNQLLITQQAILDVYEKTEQLPGVTFGQNSAMLSAEAKPILDAIASRLVKENRKVEIAGHTSSTGTPKHNLSLSQMRAESVAEYLISKGVKPRNITPVGYGMTQPVAINETQEGRDANKRVEVRYLK